MIKHMPVWCNEEGDRFVIGAKNMLFDTEDEAIEKQLELMVPLMVGGVEPSGIFKAEFDGTKAKFKHLPGELTKPDETDVPILILSGPMFDKALSSVKGVGDTDKPDA